MLVTTTLLVALSVTAFLLATIVGSIIDANHIACTDIDSSATNDDKRQRLRPAPRHE
ncbi:hypothetical protein [Bifidobacterium tibiigranuli]|jgi:hypothetical protein|uniref:hypothetical protein n=1 Tax=Bifidobacterium tibiigranuli TaxID=2172043 RepID=UPI0026EAA62A|nr:hypothetical protein [Bifidobacterium tibiigranuli]MCI2186662.1 hypothetical protein [Bifidobacterium tibiigranuli]MCI2204268.1 hypothetical protein [Bifidobacterium tibiigranuli]